jgi:endonuclease/exonuclease/phosphatase family metal-dependent hydrolase
MKVVKKILRFLMILIIVIILGFIGLIVYALISDYKPEEKEIISQSDKPSILKDSLSITLLTWNIGYAGLDKEMDFFYDGGTKVITPKDKCLDNITAIENFMKGNDTIDFIILQEVDRKSKRSYRIDEYENIAGKLAGYNPFFAKNYDVFFVPSPLSEPMGKVVSGIATYSKYVPESSTRYAFPGNMGFPTQLFYLDRCFMVNRYKLMNGKEMVLINTHNEAFDEGDIRKAQMELLKGYVLNEYKLGNYIITGGDWNMSPPDFKPAFTGNKINTSQMAMQPDFMTPDWKWVFDPTTPSNRTVIAAYDPATTTTTVIDLFLLSPNIEPVSVKCHQLNFTNSDHNPVIMKIKLNY